MAVLKSGSDLRSDFGCHSVKGERTRPACLHYDLYSYQEVKQGAVVIEMTMRSGEYLRDSKVDEEVQILLSNLKSVQTHGMTFLQTQSLNRYDHSLGSLRSPADADVLLLRGVFR